MAELANTAAGQARISAAAGRLDRTVAYLGQPCTADVPRGGGSYGSTSAEETPHFELPLELIPMEPRDAPLEVLAEVEADIDEAQVDDEQKAEVYCGNRTLESTSFSRSKTGIKYHICRSVGINNL